MSIYTQGQPTKLGLKIVEFRARTTIKTIKKFTSGNRMLEIGPGRGIFAKEAIKQGYEYDAISPYQEELQIDGAHEVFYGAWPRMMKHSYDVIVAQHVIEHCAGYEQAFVFAEYAYKYLNKGGLFFVCAPDCRYGIQQFYLRDPTHQFVTNIHRVCNLLTNAQFEIADARLAMCGLKFPWYLFIHIGVQLPLKFAMKLFPMGLLYYFTDYKPGQSTKLMKIRNIIPECRIVGIK